MNEERTATTVDLQIGLRVRARRREVGMSQESLADQLGVTFQQVQKYEKGANRIAAGRLLAIAQVMNTPVQYFYEGMLDDSADDAVGAVRVIEAMRDSETQALVMAFSRLSDPKIRRLVVALVTAVSAGITVNIAECPISDAAA